MQYKPFTTFMFRCPKLSLNNLSTILNDRNSLINYLTNSNIKEAIYIASPILFEELQKLIHDKVVDDDNINRILYSCVRYIERMSTRCTPFGLFAGCGIGKIGDETTIILENSIEKKIRLDMHYLSLLYEILINNNEIKNRICYFPNNSLYKIGKKYRYIETIYVDVKRKYQIAEIDQTSYLNKLLKVAVNGVTIDDLKVAIVSDQINEQDAKDYINELIKAKIIVPQLSQSLTGEDFLTRLIKLLENLKLSDQTILNRLKNINAILLNVDSSTDIEIYKEIISKINDIGISYEEKSLFQVDFLQNANTASLGSEMINELESAMIFLNKISQSGGNIQLKKFKDDFIRRYEDREIPLMEAIDPDIGIGYPSNSNDLVPLLLVDDLIFSSKSSKNELNNNLFQSVIFHKLTKESLEYNIEVVFTDKDIKNFEENWDDFPTTIQTLFEIVNTENEKKLLHLISCGNVSGANLLGRFAYLNKGIEQMVKDITETEQKASPNALLAEIVHSPESKVDNILSRLHIRDYELLFLSDSDLPNEQKILISDLLLSVRNGKLVIRSKRLNKEIIPRLTSAHNYNYGTMPIYRFLCEMQMQTEHRSMHFIWDQRLENELIFLPRVRFKNTILSLATWFVKIEEIKHLFVIRDDRKLIDSTEIWRTKKNIPRYVLLQDGDNELLTDFENALSVHSLFSIIKKRESVKFVEFLFNSDNGAVVKDINNGIYTNEFILPFYKH